MGASAAYNCSLCQLIPKGSFSIPVLCLCLCAFAYIAACVFFQVPVDLVVDHSVQVDVARSENAVQANMELEFSRNKERFGFLKWGSTAFNNMLVVPPGSGIVHQVFQ